MRIGTRGLVVAAAAAAVFLGNARVLQAATPPVVSSATASRDTTTGRTVVTVLGRSLTKFGSFVLKDPQAAVVMGTVDTVVRSKGTLVLRLPQLPMGSVNGYYFLEATVAATGEVETIPVPLFDLAATGTVNDSSNPVDWSQMKGVPAGFADGTDENSSPWAETMTDVYRASGRVGVGTSAPAAALHVAGNDGVLFGGTVNSGTIPATGAGVRMMWFPKKAAFRAGEALDGIWDEGNTGYWSASFGQQTAASGSASFASGYGCSAVGNYATAMGLSTYAPGANAMALGYSTNAAGETSLATGENTQANGKCSTSMGRNTNAAAYASVALGEYNVAAGTAGSPVATDPVLVVGNGTSFMATSNAFTLLRNGNLTIAGTLTQNSDLRLKRDVAPLTGVLGRIAGIRGVSYEFKDTARSPEGRQIGLVAQEVRAAYPELVREDSRGSLSVSYQNFTAVLLEAVKEQQALLEAKDAEIAAVRRELAEARRSMEERLARIESLLRK